MAIDTLEQKRARAAMEFVQRHRNNSGQRAKLRTLIQRSPVMILQNGLGQTLAFLLADAGDGQEGRNAAGLLHDRLEQWLCRERPIYHQEGGLMTQLTAGSRHDYLRAQQEALALLGWMKKFAEAWLKDGG